MVVTAVPGSVVQQVVLTGELPQLTPIVPVASRLRALTHWRLEVVASAASELLDDVGAALYVIHRGEGGGGVGGVHVAVVGGVRQSVRLDLP